MKHKAIWMFFSLGVVWVLMWAMLSNRHHDEETNKTVELALDWEEVKLISDQPDRFLEEASRMGIRSVGLYEHEMIYSSYSQEKSGSSKKYLRDELSPDLTRSESGSLSGYSVDDLQSVLGAGLYPVFRPYNDHYLYRTKTGFWFAVDVLEASVLPAGKEVVGFPGHIEQVADVLSKRNWSFLYLEMSRQKGLKELARKVSGRLVLAHSIEKKEIQRMSEGKVIRRFLRAVKERSVRFLYIRLFQYKSENENLEFIRHLSDELILEGFDVGRANPVVYTSSRVAIRQLLCFIIAFAGPLIGLKWGMKSGFKNVLVQYLLMSAVSVTAGAVIAVILYTPDFTMRLEEFRGVKAALVGPLLAAIPLLYNSGELRRIWNKPVRVKDLTWCLFFLSLLFYALMRSGNWSIWGGGEIEMWFRDQLDFLLGVRPRFKEFLFGHPLLLLGLWLYKRSSRFGLDSRMMILIGMIGQTSMINTFCHIHTPIIMSLQRTFHGYWLGLVFGVIAIFIIRKIENPLRRLLRI